MARMVQAEDGSWVPESFYASQQPVRKLATRLVAMEHKLDTLERSQRAPSLAYSSIENGYIVVRDAAGKVRQVIGRQDDATFGQAAYNGTPPPRPNTPTLTPIMAGLDVAWNGTFNETAPKDFSHLLVYVSPVENFIHGPSNLAGTLYRAGSIPVAPLPTTVHYVRFVAVNTSGVESEPSFDASATPAQVVAQAVLDGIVGELALVDSAVTTAKIAPEAVTTPKLIASAITAEKIAALAVIADKIAANAVTAGKIEAGAVTAAKLAATLAIVSRIEMYKTDGTTLAILLDGPTGNALFRGEVATALSGNRIVVNPGGEGQPSIRFYPTTGSAYADLISTNAVGSSVGAVALRSSLDANGKSSQVVIYPAGAGLLFLRSDGKQQANVSANETRSEMRGPQTVLYASSQYLDANPRTIAFAHQGSTGAVIDASVLQQRAVPEAVLASPSQDVLLKWWNGNLESRNNADNGFKPMQASAFNVNSARAVKQNVRDLPTPALDVVTAAPSKMWEYVPAPAYTAVGAIPDPDGGPARDIHHPAETPRPRVGPMADDLPDYLVTGSGDDRAVDAHDKIGMLWAAVAELHAEVKALAARLPAPRAP